jgi:cell division septum initiation protein DivIVA
MTKKVAEKIVRGIQDKIDCNTADIDDWAEFWGFTREEYEEFLDLAIKALEQEPFINKSCVSSGVCEHDKNKVLDKLRTEIEQLTSRYTISRERGGMGQVEWSDMLIKESEVLEIIDKYKAESEETETWNGIHAQITAPKGTFERIFNEADDDTDI